MFSRGAPDAADASLELPARQTHSEDRPQLAGRAAVRLHHKAAYSASASPETPIQVSILHDCDLD